MRHVLCEPRRRFECTSSLSHLLPLSQCSQALKHAPIGVRRTACKSANRVHAAARWRSAWSTGNAASFHSRSRARTVRREKVGANKIARRETRGKPASAMAMGERARRYKARFRFPSQDGQACAGEIEQAINGPGATLLARVRGAQVPFSCAWRVALRNSSGLRRPRGPPSSPTLAPSKRRWQPTSP